MPTEPVPVNEYITDLEAQWDGSKVDSNFSSSVKPNFIEVTGDNEPLRFNLNADDVVIGIVKSLTATEITLTTNNIGALTDDDELFTPHQLEFIFDIEY